MSLIFLQLYLFYYFLTMDFIIIILTITIFDTSSYLLGSLIGRTKILSISPNKTYEGLFGGSLISFSLSLLFAFIFEINVNINLIFYILLIILFAFIGDIIESYFKRKNNLKNSSEFIPGHGGVFDRFDSFLFSIIIYSISINILL